MGTRGNATGEAEPVPVKADDPTVDRPVRWLPWAVGVAVAAAVVAVVLLL